MTIIFKDILKPRYALVIEPSESFFGNAPVIKMVPFKRSLSMSYVDFMRQMQNDFGISNTVIYGHMFVFRLIDGLGGSILPHNVKNSILVKNETIA